MHRTPLLMIPPLRGAKPPFGGPIKNGVATILGSFPSYSSFGLWRERWKKIPLERGIPAKYHVTPSVFRHPLFYRRAWNAAKRSSLAGKNSPRGLLDFISGAGAVYVSWRIVSILCSFLLSSPFFPLFFSSPGKGECQIWFRIENFTGVQISFFCRKSGGKRRDGISEFSWSIERFFLFFFLLGVRGNNVERIWWKIIESDWERGYSLIEWCVKGDGIEVWFFPLIIGWLRIMRLLIIRQIYSINFYWIDFYWWYVKEIEA